VTFNDDKLERVKRLMTAMWHSVTTLELPDVSAYNNTATASKQFQADLITSNA
jgi:hypothetical protein